VPDVKKTPLAILAHALAYVIEADNRTTFEEKAKMITVLGKHVARGEMSQKELHQMANDAFERAHQVSVEKFLDNVIDKLTPAQKTSIVINLYDAMLVDGQVVAGERKILEQFIGAFEMDRGTMRAIREVAMLKNDTGLFIDPNHPYNEPSYRLELELIGALDADQPPELN